MNGGRPGCDPGMAVLCSSRDRLVLVESHSRAGKGVNAAMTRSLRLYDYAASCNCYKVRLLLAHLDRPYERVPVDIFSGATLSDEYARLNPARTTPVLELADGRHLPESGAI